MLNPAKQVFWTWSNKTFRQRCLKFFVQCCVNAISRNILFSCRKKRNILSMPSLTSASSSSDSYSSFTWSSENWQQPVLILQPHFNCFQTTLDPGNATNCNCTLFGNFLIWSVLCFQWLSVYYWKERGFGICRKNIFKFIHCCSTRPIRPILSVIHILVSK